MCVIIYKPIGKKLPSTKVLEKNFKANPDGAGYMLPYNDKVIIRKGFMTFDAFKKDISNYLKIYHIDVENTPIVIHFRITTQGGVQKALCHPYPICRDYDEMRKLDNECDIALAHNGIIHNCSTSAYSRGHWDANKKCYVWDKKPVDFNDTMTFIKDYASLVIDGDDYFARNDNKCELLERLCEYSKLAIMNSKGFVKLIGQFFERKGIYYSNLHAFDDESFLSSLLKNDDKDDKDTGFKSSSVILSPYKDRFDDDDYGDDPYDDYGYYKHSPRW